MSSVSHKFTPQQVAEISEGLDKAEYVAFALAVDADHDVDRPGW